MGELILCQGRIAAMPYYIENASLNIYSLEELCYYMDTYTDCLDEAFFGQELCNWLKWELGLPELAGELERCRDAKGQTAQLSEIVLRACGYLTAQEQRALLAQLRELDGKDDFTRRKLRADRRLRNHRYAESILEYRRLLQGAEEAGALAADVGNIWHNMGVACANMFLYEQASECFSKAYEYNNLPESAMELYFAKQCMAENGGGSVEVPKEWRHAVTERLNRASDEPQEDAPAPLAEEQLPLWKKQYRLYSRL